MKIRFTKANGSTMELSDVACVEVVEANLVRIVRMEPFAAAERSFVFEPHGSGSGICIYDKDLPLNTGGIA